MYMHDLTMQVQRMKTVQYRDSRYRDRRLMSIKIIKSSRFQDFKHKYFYQEFLLKLEEKHWHLKIQFIRGMESTSSQLKGWNPKQDGTYENLVEHYFVSTNFKSNDFTKLYCFQNDFKIFLLKDSKPSILILNNFSFKNIFIFKVKLLLILNYLF